MTNQPRRGYRMILAPGAVLTARGGRRNATTVTSRWQRTSPTPTTSWSLSGSACSNSIVQAGTPLVGSTRCGLGDEQHSAHLVGQAVTPASPARQHWRSLPT